MNELLFHPLTQLHIDELVSQPPHAVLLMAPVGSGKGALAVAVSELILGLAPQKLELYPYKMRVLPEEGKISIGIKAVRELEHFLSLRVPTQAAFNRVVIIENAHNLTIEAQNALLKTLEEPPQGVFIIMTASSDQALLPTVRSRVQTIQIQRPEQAAIQAYFTAKNFTEPSIKQAYAISGGLTGLMQALLENSDHPLLQATQRARQLLSQSTYERLLVVDELSKQRSLALNTTFILQQMAHVSLQTASGAAAVKWQTVLTAAYQASEALSDSAQPKLVLTNLMLNL